MLSYSRGETHQKSFKIPGDIRKGIGLMEFFGHGSGVALIILTLWKVDHQKRRFIPLLVACSFGSSLLANLTKLVVSRARPSYFDFEYPILYSFQGFSPFTNFVNQTGSFPSGHTTLAFGFAVGMTYLYPQGRVLFLIFAILVALQRIIAVAHFPSDTFAGAVLGVSAAWMFIRLFNLRCRWQENALNQCDRFTD